MVSVKRGVTGCFRTEEGAREFVTIWSYLSSAHKHRVSYYDAIYQAFSGNAMDVLFSEKEV